MDLTFFYQLIDNFAFLILSAIGLMIIFGMMGVINMAHGELMMVGAYVSASSFYTGVPIPLAVFLGGLAAALVGIALERVIIRRFYHQLLSSLVVTWGIGIVFSQGFLIVLGPSMSSIPTPFSYFSFAGANFATYRLVMFLVAILLIAAVFVLFTRTRFGIKATATMESPDMARAMGVNTGLVYAATFGLGSFLAGIAGGMFAMTSTITPFFGQGYTPLAFITVVVGGAASPILGLLSSAFVLSGVQTIIDSFYSVYLAYMAVFGTALLILVFFPSGISEFILRPRGLKFKNRVLKGK